MHIGSLIKQTLVEQGRTSCWLARELFCSRANIYKIYNKKSLDSDLLLRISVLLKHDFFADYRREYEQRVSNR